MPAELTNKQQTILNVILDSEASLTASEITAQNPELNINTVQGVLRSLLKTGYIEVADIVYSGTVLCRSYRPTKKAVDWTFQKLLSLYRCLRKHLSFSQIFKILIDAIDAEEDQNALIAGLEAVLAEMKASSSNKKGR